jgi:hypothetical protein
MTDPKAALTRTVDSHSSTVGAQLSSLSLADDSETCPSPSSDYQVFILAGFGHKYVHCCVSNVSLYPLTEDNNLPKALLPVADTPLLQYPLEWCQKAGFVGRS